jgi:hypothetical protein
MPALDIPSTYHSCRDIRDSGAKGLLQHGSGLRGHERPGVALPGLSAEGDAARRVGHMSSVEGTAGSEGHLRGHRPILGVSPYRCLLQARVRPNVVSLRF